MEILYCDQCGIRVSEKDLAEGRAARRDTRVLCAKCQPVRVPPAARIRRTSRSSIMPAARREQASEHRIARLKHGSKNTPSRAALLPHDNARKVSATQHATPKRNMGLVLSGAGLGLIGLALVLLSRDAGQSGTHRADAAAGRSNAARQPSRETLPPAHAMKAKPSVEFTRGPTPPAGVRPPAPAPSVKPPPEAPAAPEQRAREALAALFNGVPESDQAQRATLLENFLKQYGQTIVAARARAMRAELQKRAAANVTAPLQPSAPSQSVLDIRIAASADDAEELASGEMFLNSTDLELVHDPERAGDQVVGLRFPKAAIPPGAVIVNAYVQFTVDEPTSQPTSLKIEGQAGDDAPAFLREKKNITARPRTQASVAWSPPPWTQGGLAGPDQRTPNLAPLLQEIVNRPGWSNGRALALIFSGSGKRVAMAFDDEKGPGAPLLHVECRKGRGPSGTQPLAAKEKTGAGEEPATPATPVSSVSSVSGEGPPAPPAQPAERQGDKRLASIRAEIMPLAHKNEFRAALALLAKKLAGPELAGIVPRLKQEQADLEAVLAVRRQAVAALQKKTGEWVRLKQGKGLITGQVAESSSPEAIALKLRSGPVLAVHGNELHPEDVVRFAAAPDEEEGGASAEAWRRRGLLFLYAGKGPRAKEFFLRAQKAGLGERAQPYLARAEALLTSADEKRAGVAWTRAEAAFRAKHWKRAQKAYTAFEKNFSSTRFLDKRKALLKTRLAAIVQVLNPLKPGLLAAYFKGMNLPANGIVLIREDAQVDFGWKLKAPAPEVPKDKFSVRWMGFIQIEKPGPYTFTTASDDGVRLWVDRNLLIDDWTHHPVKKNSATLVLSAGRHALRMEFFDSTSTAICRLYWSLPGAFPETLIPTEVLWHDPKAREKLKEAPAPKLPKGKLVYLSDIREVSARVGHGQFGKSGALGYGKKPGQRIQVKGFASPHGLSTHPPDNGSSRVSYRIDKQFRLFRARVTLNDTVRRSASKLTFKVLGDGRLLWQSLPVQFSRKLQPCVVNISGVDKLTLEVACPGKADRAHAVWVEPHVLRP